MLADRVDDIIGVDTHTATHTAAVVTPTGAALAHQTVPADADGYLHVYRFAVEQAPGRRVWAIEGTGSYGAGLTTHLLEQGEWVVEVDRPARPARRNGAKTDDLDAVRAAREALGREHLAQPRQRGDREAIGVLVTTRQSAMQARTCAINHLKALVVNAPERRRRQLRALATDQLLARCAGLRSHPTQPIDYRATIAALRRTAQRSLALAAEADDLHAELDTLIRRRAPGLLAEPGIGVVCAAQLLNAWSHAGRLRSEAAFAMLGGAAPIEHRRARSCVIASTAAVTGSATGPCTPSSCHPWPTTPRPAPTSPAASRRARQRGRSNAASLGDYPGRGSMVGPWLLGER
jgi:transposase